MEMELDHAWGGHHIVMGGDGNNTSGNLNGGQLLGTVPNVTLEGMMIIPTKVVSSQLLPDQLNAAICQWFGVAKEEIEDNIFPNLAHFAADSKYLDLFVP